MKKIFNLINSFRQKLGKWIWIIIIAAVVIVWRIIFASSAVTKVQTAAVTKGDIIETVSTSGTIKADKYVALTFPTGGLITGVGVKTGDQVNKGQFIAQIDAVVLNALYQNAVNTYRSTQAAMQLEHDNDKNYGSGETFAEKNIRTAAEVANDNAYNAMLAAQDNLKNAAIFAPFKGIIDTASPSAPGINVLPGAANYTIVDPSSVYFDAEVEETDLPNVAVGQNANIALDAYRNTTISGKVAVIGLVAFTSSTGGNAYHIRVSLPDNSNQKFRVGMQGDVGIVYATVSDTLKVSTSAINTEADKSYVFVIENGKAKKTQVEVGAASDTETEIKSGLSDGQIVVDNPPSNLGNGAKVNF